MIDSLLALKRALLPKVALTCYDLLSQILHFSLPSTCPRNDGDAADVRTALFLLDGNDDKYGADDVGASKLPVKT